MTSLELVVDQGSREVPADRFFRAGVDLIGLLDELVELPCDWIVTELRTGSAVAVVAAAEQSADSVSAMASAVAGLRSAANRHIGPGWTPDAIGSAERFAAHFTQPAIYRSHLRLLPDPASGLSGEDVELSQGLSAAIAALKPAVRSVPGAVRGTLLGVNVNRGNRASVKTRAGRTVRVGFGNDLREPLREAMYKPIELIGTVRREPTGEVFRISATEVREIEKPTIAWSDLFGYEPGFTGGSDRRAFLEVLRGQA